MPSGSEKVNEFERYRQVLQALYGGAICAVFAILAASVVAGLYRHSPDSALAESGGGRQVSPGVDGPATPSVEQCYARCVGLFHELDSAMAVLLAQLYADHRSVHPGPSDGREYGGIGIPSLSQWSPPSDTRAAPRYQRWDRAWNEWREFSASWLTRWQVVGQQCRISSDRVERGEAYTHLMRLHDMVSTLHRQSQRLLAGIQHEYVVPREQLTRDLGRMRQLLDQAGGEEAQ